MSQFSKAQLLRRLLHRHGPVLVAGAHNGLSARIVEGAGFDAVWASGFEISASFAVPDANLLTMAENLAVAKSMNMAVGLPVIADCDGGYGNAVNVIRTVREYEAAGVAGICLEDNAFPKRCSFYESSSRRLEDEQEFAAKIAAAVSARSNPDFVVIARTEALIVGLGIEAALSRALAYADAGSDLCLIHSKSTTPSEIYEFAARWDQRVPLVCVPTKYKQTSVDELHDAGIKVVIFANHGLRSAIKAMQQALTAIATERRAAAADPFLVSLSDVDELVGVPELLLNEKRYVERQELPMPPALRRVAGRPMSFAHDGSNSGSLLRQSGGQGHDHE